MPMSGEPKKAASPSFRSQPFLLWWKPRERSIRWLEGVAKRTITPNLPKLMGDETETAATFMLEAENGGHNAWWQPLNNHWTSIEQTLNKPCSSPSNEVCGACQTTHEYEKRKSDREIERRHYLDEMLPLLKKGTFDGQKTTLLYKKSESWFASALLLATNR